MPSFLRAAPTALALAIVIATAGVAHAQDEPEREAERSAWNISFLGGMYMPLRDTEAEFKTGLALGARFGWTSRIGLGFELAGSYTPLARKDVPELTSIETHFIAATAGPRLALGRTFRVSLAATGGLAHERATTFVRDLSTGTETALAPVVRVALGFDLNFTSAGGIAVIASGHKTYADLDYEYLQVLGGLNFNF